MSILQSDSIAGTVVDAIPGGSTASGILDLLGGLFSKRPNPNDWMGWASDEDSIHWLNNDGDSVQNEAGNVLSYIQNRKQGDLRYLVGRVTPTQLRSKLMRGGYGAVADSLANTLTQLSYPQANIYGNNSVQTLRPTPEPGSNPQKSSSWLPIVIVIAVVAILVFVFMSKGKK